MPICRTGEFSSVWEKEDAVPPDRPGINQVINLFGF